MESVGKTDSVVRCLSVVPVCPHAGGVGLCEMVQHLSIFDYVCVSTTFNDRSQFDTLLAFSS